MHKLPDAIGLARGAMRVVRQDVAMSLVAVVALVAAALAGWLGLTSGLLLNEGTALLIIANGLRLLRSPAEVSGGVSPPERTKVRLAASPH